MESDEILQVTDAQEVEDSISMEIQRIFPLIFTGNNTEAKEKLTDLYETIRDRYDNHPDFAAVLNGIGLTLQRGTKDMNEALNWYRKSYEERRSLKNICPQLMVPTMNNMAMILCRQGDPVAGEKYLREALDILNAVGPSQYYTALTLTHLSEVKVKQGDFNEAYKVTQKAEGIIQRTNKNHDFRLKINLTLVHHALVLGHSESSSRPATPSVDESVDSLIRLGAQVKGYLSDDGHHYLMSSYEHGLLLHWRNSERKFELYKRDLLAHVEEHQFLRDILFKRNAKTFPSSLLADHRDFLEYIRNTDCKDLKFQKLLSLLLKACPFCRSIRDKIEEDVWAKEVERLNLEKQRRDNLTEEVFLDFSNSLSSINETIQFINGSDLPPDLESQQIQERSPEACAISILKLQVINPSGQSLIRSEVVNPSDFEEISGDVALSETELRSATDSWEILGATGEQESFNVINASRVRGSSPIGGIAETPQYTLMNSAFAEITPGALATDLTSSFAEVINISTATGQLWEMVPARASAKAPTYFKVENPSIDVESLVSSELSHVTNQDNNRMNTSRNVTNLENHLGIENTAHNIVNPSYYMSNTPGFYSNFEIGAENTLYAELDSTNYPSLSPRALGELPCGELSMGLASLPSDPLFSLCTDASPVGKVQGEPDINRKT